MQRPHRGARGHASLLTPRWISTLPSRLWHVVVWGYVLSWCSLLLLRPIMAQEAQPAEEEYAHGLAAYAHCNFAKARDHFLKAVAQEPNNTQAHFYLGLSRSYLHEFGAAIESLQKALELDPSLQQGHYYLGWLYSQQGHREAAQDQFKQAAAEGFDPPLTHYYQGVAFYELGCMKQGQEAFTAVIQADRTSPAAQSARRYLDAIKTQEREQRWLQLAGTVSFQYDDNVVLEPNNEAFAFGRHGDGRTVFDLVGRVQTRPSLWHLGAEYEFFQSVHFDLHDFDLQSHTGRVFARLDLDRVTLRAAADYTYTLLHNDSFSEVITVEPSATIRQTEALYAVVLARYSTSRFFNQFIPTGQEKVRDRDGWAMRLGFDQYFVFNQQQSYARFRYHFEWSRNDGTDWEYDGHHIALGLHMPLLWDIALDVDGGYTRRDYLHINSFDTSPLAVLTPTDRRARLDNRLAGSVVLTRPVGDYLRIIVGFVHISNLSNIDFFDYRRNIVTLALTGRY